MQKIKDRILLGAITGTLVSAPLQVFDIWLDKRGITDVNYGPSAAKIFLTKNKTKTTGGRIIAAAINTVNTGAVATAIAYTLSLTGKDNAMVKGAGIGALMWVGLAGFLSRVGLNIKSEKPSSPLTSLALHLIFGAMCGYTITKLGDDSLFPDSNVREQQKVPVFYTGANASPYTRTSTTLPNE